MKRDLAIRALKMAIALRSPPGGCIFHSDRGSQYVSIKYTERLAEAEIDLSVGTVGDAYDNALAECVIGLLKTEVINQIGPWKSMREVEWETLKWVDWYNNPSQVHSNLWRSPARPSRSYRLRPTRRSRGGVETVRNFVPWRILLRHWEAFFEHDGELAFDGVPFAD
jgi:transposase InsO family protein